MESLNFDKFGNPIEIETYSDGRSKQVTVTDNSKNFVFLGDTYNIEVLRDCEDLKLYYSSSISKAVLKRDCYGRLLLFFFDDWVSGRMDLLWVVVADEADADEMVGVPRLSRLREPYIAADAGDWMIAHGEITSYSNSRG